MNGNNIQNRIDGIELSLFGIDRIVGNRVLLTIFACLLVGKLCTKISSVSSPYIFFVTSAILFSEEHKVCSFGN